jgi:SAM-dependent methyltransferase
VSDRAARSRSFENVAEEYERHRPDYPEEALRWTTQQLELDGPARVLDIGAGTGKLTRGLVALGFEVVAVEPGPPMVEQLRAAMPEVEAHVAPAEALPLQEASVDAAFAGQAFHWFDRERAVPELHRVIRPGGGLALLWNWWDERDPLQRELGGLVGYAGHQPYRDDELPAEPWFRELGRTVVETAPESSPDSLVAYLATSSMFLTMDADERDRLLAEVRAIASRYGEWFPLPKLTYVFAFARLS